MKLDAQHRIKELQEKRRQLQFQVHGAPPVCTAKWTEQDFEQWFANQARLQKELGELLSDILALTAVV